MSRTYLSEAPSQPGYHNVGVYRGRRAHHHHAVVVQVVVVVVIIVVVIIVVIVVVGIYNVDHQLDCQNDTERKATALSSIHLDMRPKTPVEASPWPTNSLL